MMVIINIFFVWRSVHKNYKTHDASITPERCLCICLKKTEQLFENEHSANAICFSNVAKTGCSIPTNSYELVTNFS